MNNEVMIGLEVHVQLNTTTKLFCGCPTQGSEEPNTRTCEVCLGHPGSKPVVNKKAVLYAMKIALALGCVLSPTIQFSRKTYFYPDMSKNYQITQYEIPLGTKGSIMLESGKIVRLKRIHIEEDPAALLHQEGFCLVDYNRSGIPLVEIVTEPDMNSPAEAREFMKKLLAILKYLNVFDVDKCIVKADANVSIKRTNFTRVELKNITGFKEIERALAYEIKRQEQHEVIRETRAWDAVAGFTKSMRSKEFEEDYGYIIDPDLVTIELSEAWINEVKRTIPELGIAKASRFVREYGIDKDDAKILAMELELAELFERLAEKVNPILTARWLRRELLRVLNAKQKEVRDINEKYLLELLQLLEKKEITDRIGQQLIAELAERDFSPKAFVKEKGLGRVVDEVTLKGFCEDAIKEQPKAVADYKTGKKEALDFLMGQVMRKTKGTASPEIIRKLLKELVG